MALAGDLLELGDLNVRLGCRGCGLILMASAITGLVAASRSPRCGGGPLVNVILLVF